jgi:hypothetical protein
MAILRNGVNTDSKHANGNKATVTALALAPAPAPALALIKPNTNVDTLPEQDKERGLFLLDYDTFQVMFAKMIIQLAKEKSKPKKYVYRWFTYSKDFNPSGLDLDKTYFIASNKYEMMMYMLKTAEKQFMCLFLNVETIEECCYENFVDDRYAVDTNDMKQIVKHWFSYYNGDNDTFWFEKFEPICA